MIELTRKYVTRQDSYPVTLFPKMVQDEKSPFPILAVVHTPTGDRIHRYTQEGCRYVSHSSGLDLVPFVHPLQHLPLRTPVWVRNFDSESWLVAMFAGVSLDSISTPGVFVWFGTDSKEPVSHFVQAVVALPDDV